MVEHNKIRPLILCTLTLYLNDFQTSLWKTFEETLNVFFKMESVWNPNNKKERSLIDFCFEIGAHWHKKRRARCPHQFSIIFRCGLTGGHSNNWILFSKKPSFRTLGNVDTWQDALSSWNIASGCKSGLRCWLRISVCFWELRRLSKKTNEVLKWNLWLSKSCNNIYQLDAGKRFPL